MCSTQYVQWFNIHKSAGPYRTVLKETIEKVQLLSFIIIWCSLQSGVVPKDCMETKKFSSYIPAYKVKSSNTNPSNYNPVSFTSIVSKLFEKIISSHVMKYLESYGLGMIWKAFANISCELVLLVLELMVNYDKPY